MRKHFTKKRIVLLAVVALAIGIGTAAFAYFTSTGTGTGTAQVGSASAWLVGETATAPTGGLLYPDDAIGGANVQTDEYSVTNPSAGNQSLAQVVISVATSTGGVWSSRPIR